MGFAEISSELKGQVHKYNAIDLEYIHTFARGVICHNFYWLITCNKLMYVRFRLKLRLERFCEFVCKLNCNYRRLIVSINFVLVLR